MKSDKMSYIIMPTLNLWFKKIDGCANYPEKSWTIEIAEPIPCRYLMSAIRGCNNIENKHALYLEEMHERVLHFFKRTCYKCNYFWKEKCCH